MSKKPKQDLFDLIKSLSKGERKSFNLYVNYYSSGEKKYLQLFEIMDRQKQLDEEKIKLQLQKNKIKTPLAQLKVYLLELILKSLRFHHSGRGVESQLRDLFADVEICHRKNLNDLRDKQLKKARLIAQSAEKYDSLLTVLNKEWYTDANEGENIIEEYRCIRQQIADQNEFYHLIIKLRMLEKKGHIRDEYLNREWEYLIQNPLMNREREPSGFEESYNYYRIWAAYYSRMGDFEKWARYQELITLKLESRPEMLKEMPTRYMLNFNNLIVSYGRIRNNEGAKEAMHKLLKMQEMDLNAGEKDMLANSIILAYSNLIHGYVMASKFNELHPLITDAEFFVEANRSGSFYKSVLYFTLSTYYLFCENYKKALSWINLFLNEPVKFQTENKLTAGRLLNLILHYELKHMNIIPNLTLSIYRFLFKRKRLYKAEGAILAFIRNKMPKANSYRELVTFFNELKSELEEIVKDPFEANAFEDFDFISWLDSKIQNRPLIEVMSEKLKAIDK